MTKRDAPIYAGIGSRRTPSAILSEMTEVGSELGRAGWLLRSGHAEGADRAFEAGCDLQQAPKEIFIPWSGFNGSRASVIPVTDEAMRLAAQMHPAWHRCSPNARKLHARNGYQILGRHLDTPATVVIAWTPGGQLEGGTAQALRIAMTRRIPIFNFGAPPAGHRPTAGDAVRFALAVAAQR